MNSKKLLEINMETDLNFKDSKYATGKEKHQLLEFGLKKEQENIQLMEKIMILLRERTIKCNY